MQEMFIDTKALEMSSLHRRTSLTTTGHRLERRSVETRTLDSIFERAPVLERPILLKIDTEGNELRALRGACPCCVPPGP
jgi:FkbM family methyltransferase